jgi:hypothetical protein
MKHNRIQTVKILPPLSVEAIEVCIPTGNSEMLLAAVYNLQKDCEVTKT